METARRIHQHHVRVPGLGRSGRVEDHSGGVGPLVLLDDLHPGPVRPDGQLVGGGSPEGVGGTEQHLFPLLAQLMADLADGGGLTHPVHSDEQDHRRAGGEVQRRLPHVHHVGDASAHAGARLLHRLDVLVPHPAAQFLHQLQSGVHPCVRQNQGLLQLVVKVVGEFRTEAGKDVDLFQFVKKAHVNRFLSSNRSSRRNLGSIPQDIFPAKYRTWDSEAEARPSQDRPQSGISQRRPKIVRAV